MADSRYSNSVYNYGSTVFQPERRSEQERREKEREYISDARKRIESRVGEMKSTDVGRQILKTFAAAAVILVLVALFSAYIMQLSVKRNLRSEITELEREVQDLSRENALLRNQFERDIDYNFVYNYATERLGMQVPEKHQVIRYRAQKNEYVVKSGDIPHE